MKFGAKIVRHGCSPRLFTTVVHHGRHVTFQMADYLAGFFFNHDWDPGPCLAHYERALFASRRCDDKEGILRALTHRVRASFTFGTGLYGGSNDLSPLQDAVDALGDDAPTLRGFAMATMAEALFTGRQPDRAEEMASQALALGEKHGDDALCRNASVALGLARTQQMDLEGAVSSFEESCRAARRSSDPWIEVAPMVRLSAAQIQLGRLDESDRLCETSLREARRLHDLAETSYALSSQAALAMIRGDFEISEEVFSDWLAREREAVRPSRPMC